MPSAPIPTICLFAHAGGGSVGYTARFPQLAKEARLLPVDLPGHGTKLGRPLLETIPEMVDALCAEVEPIVARADGGSVGVFGHSMGGMLAYLVARRLESKGLRVGGLCVSAAHVPGYTGLDPRLLGMTLSAFEEVAENYPGVPREVLESSELRKLFLPPLLTDFQAILRYAQKGARPLEPIRAPVMLIAPTADRFSLREQLAWRRASGTRFRIERVPGGHFYFLEDAGARDLDERLRRFFKECLARTLTGF